MRNKVALNIRKLFKNDFWKNLFKNSFWAFAGDSGAAIVGLIITILLIRLIGNDGYGTLILAQSYMLIMDVLLNIQSWKGVIQYGQGALIKNKIDDFYGYIKMGCILDIGTAILGGVFAIAIAGLVGCIFNWSNELIVCAQIFSITIFSHFAGTPTALLRIFNKFNLVAIQKIVSAVLKLSLFGVIFVIYGKVDLILAVVAYAITDIIGNILLIVLAAHEFRKKYSMRKMLKSKYAHDNKKFIKYTLWGSFSEIVDLPIQYFDVFVVSILNTELVAVYKVFQQIASIISKLTTALHQAIMPQFSELSAKGSKRRGYEIVLKMRNAILVCMGSISLIIGFSSPIWLKFIYGEVYASYWYILLLFMLMQTILISYATIHPYFISLGKTKESALYVLVANVLYMILALSTIEEGGLLALIICNFIQGLMVIVFKTTHIKRTLRKEEIS